MASDDYEQRSVRIWRITWRAVHRIQMEREAERGAKPSIAEVIEEAVAVLEKSRAN